MWVWDTTTGATLFTHHGSFRNPTVIWSPNGRCLIFVDEMVQVWDVNNKEDRPLLTYTVMLVE